MLSFRPPAPTLTAILLCAVPASGAPVPFADLAPTGPAPELVDSDPAGFAPLGDGVAFWAEDGIHGREVWWTDGASFRRLSDLCPGPCGAREDAFLVARPDGALVLAELPDGRSGLWHLGVDGVLEKRFDFGLSALTSEAPTAAPAFVVFVLAERGGTWRLWATDGTSGGTFRLPPSDAEASFPTPRNAVVVDDEIWFAATTHSAGRELWATDGTPEGTRLRLDLCPGSCNSNPEVLGRVGDRIVLRGSGTGLGVEPFALALDGTEAVLLADLDPGPSSAWPVRFADLGGELYLRAPYRDMVWRTDGTPAGTRPVPDLRPPGTALLREPAFRLGDRLVFEVLPEEGVPTLWSWHAGTGELLLVQHGETERRFDAAARLGDEVLFWRDDGRRLEATDGVSVRLIHESPLPFEVGAFTAIGGRLWYAGRDAAGREPWSTDGTAAGTSAIADVHPARSSSDPARPTSRPDGLWALASTPESGRDLWRIDAAGAAPVEAAVDLRDAWWTTERAFGVTPTNALLGLDPTASSWIDLHPGALREAVVWREALWFATHDAGQPLWRSDGTPGGTGIAVDVDPEWAPCGVILCSPEENLFPRQLTAAGDTLFFIAVGPDEPLALWATDGTDAGTRPLRSGELHPVRLASWGDRLFVEARSEAGRTEVWISDGTSPGTRRLVTSPEISRALHPLALPDGRLFVLEDAAGDGELWRTGGTAASTRRLSSFGHDGGTLGAAVLEATATGNRAFFSVRDESFGTELWVSDGRAAGTFRLDLWPGAPGSGPSDLTALPDGRIAFAASRSETGHEPWISDGTVAGTRLLGEVRPGPDGSSPARFVVHEGSLVFAATHADAGRELFSVELPSPVAGCPDDRACLHGGRFRVGVTREGPQGDPVPALPVPLGSDRSALFWFFAPANLEVMLKVLDGCGVNGHFWIFAAAPTDVGHRLEVVDTSDGSSWIAVRPPGESGPALVDVEAFACGPAADQRPASRLAIGPPTDVPARPMAEPASGSDDSGSCRPSATAHCLSTESRFRVEVEWRDFAGREGSGQAIPYGIADSGLFWFFEPGNQELLVKVLDGCGVNDRFWVFAAATTTVEHTLRVTDTATGLAWEATNPAGRPAPAILATDAIAACP